MIKVPSFFGYTKPTRYRPQWRVESLAFQGGMEHIRTGSLTGGGQVYGHEYSGTFVPVIQAYATPITSLVAGGQMPALPPALQALLGGANGNGT